MMKRIVVLGGGTGGTLTANRLRLALGQSVEITVVDRDEGIITVGELYDLADGGEIIFT